VEWFLKSSSKVSGEKGSVRRQTTVQGAKGHDVSSLLCIEHRASNRP